MKRTQRTFGDVVHELAEALVGWTVLRWKVVIVLLIMLTGVWGLGCGYGWALFQVRHMTFVEDM